MRCLQVVVHAEVSAAQDAQAALKLALALYGSRVDSGTIHSPVVVVPLDSSMKLFASLLLGRAADRYAAALRNFPDREGWSTLGPMIAAAERSQLDHLSPTEVYEIRSFSTKCYFGSS